MSTASLQRVGLGVLLFGWLLTTISTGVAVLTGLGLAFFGLCIVVAAWLHDV